MTTIGRIVIVVSLLVAGTLAGQLTVAQGTPDRPVDLAAMPVPPHELPEGGFQLARGGYLTRDDARHMIADRYSAGDETAASVLEDASWRQGYSSTFVLLSDRSIRTSESLAGITTTIHELDSDAGAMLLEALLGGNPPDGEFEGEPAVDGAVTWRAVTSENDTLVTIVRHGRFVIEVVSADRERAPDAGEHAAVVGQTLERVERIDESGSAGLSQQMVLVEDHRLIPMAVPTESPLVHTWYRVIDDAVVPAAGELEAPVPGDLPSGLEEMVIARQTAELASQNWVTTGVVLARFGTPAAASGFDGVLRDPMDEFAVSEDGSLPDASEPGVTIGTISGETRVGGRYSGYRITVVEGATVSQLTIRAMGRTLIDREAVEVWALLQAGCVTGGSCDDVALSDLLATPDPATPVVAAASVGIYESPVAPWTVTYDTEMWQERDRFAEGGYDYLYLRSERMDATFETIVNHHGDPEQCVLDELDRLREDEDRAAITVGSDDESEQPGGLGNGHGWIVYTVEPLEESRAGEEYTIRIDCYTVVEGATSLVVIVRAPRDAWSEVAHSGETLRSQIQIDGVPVGRMTGDLLRYDPTTRSDVMINRRPWVGIAA